MGRIRFAILCRNFLQLERPPKRDRSCIRSSGMGIFISTSTFCAFRMMRMGEMVRPQKTGSVAPMVAFEFKA